MENRYTINQLSTICKVSSQSIYKLLAKNQPTVKQFSTKQGRKILYGQEVLDLLLAHYNPQQVEGQDEAPKADTPANAPNKPVEASSLQVEDDPTQSEIDALQAKIEALEKRLAETEAEKKELLRQNGQVLLLLSQEREERIKLLPAPKKSFGERIKGLFSKNGTQKM